MKKLIFSFLLLISTSAFAQTSAKDTSILQDNFIRQNLIGEWKDQNSTTVFKKNGTYSTTFDDGNAEHGKWSVEKNVLAFKGEITYSFSAYNIISFSPTKMEYQSVDTQSDNTIWIAFKTVKKRK